MALPAKVEDWTAPWEKEGEELDGDKAKALLFNVMKREEKAKADLSASKDEVSTLTTERDGLQKQVTAAEKGDNAEVTRLTGENEKLTNENAELKKGEHARLTAEIALEKGLSPAQRKRLQGKDRDELEADADELLEAWGTAKSEDEGGDGDEGKGGDEGGDHPLHGRPRTSTPGDPKRGAPVERTRDETLQEIGGGDFHY